MAFDDAPSGPQEARGASAAQESGQGETRALRLRWSHRTSLLHQRGFQAQSLAFCEILGISFEFEFTLFELSLLNDLDDPLTAEKND